MIVQIWVCVPQLRPQKLVSFFLVFIWFFFLQFENTYGFRLSIQGCWHLYYMLFHGNSLFFAIWFDSSFRLLHGYLCFYLFVHELVGILWCYELNDEL